MQSLRLAVVGAGVIGRRHGELIGRAAGVRLAAIADPSEPARSFAAGLGVAWYGDLDDLLQAEELDGIVLATPNALHLSGALAVIARGIPVLVEKPLATCFADAMRIAEAAQAARVPVLVGHHRRHNPILCAARACVASGRLGRLTAVTGMTLFHKPDSYFEPAWRRSAEAGPILINLVHGIDDLRFICGEIDRVEAFASHGSRGLDAEDAGAIILRFGSGALGTFAISDATVAPWSWELTAGENTDYPQNNASCYFIGGNNGSFSLPDLELWSYEGERSWNAPLLRRRLVITPCDPLVAQLDHFIEIIRGKAEPICDAFDAARTIKVIEDIKAAAARAAEA